MEKNSNKNEMKKKTLKTTRFNDELPFELCT